jgi:hypothetical protein
MFCPNCGKDNSTGQRFCRSCGMGLEAVSQVVASELSAGGAGRWPRWDVPLGYGFFMLLLGLAVIFVGNTLLHTQLMADIGALLALLGVAIFGYRGLQLLMSRPAGGPAKSGEQQALPKSEPTVRLPSAEQFEGVPSVADQTTRDLEPAKLKRKSE